VDQQPRPAKGHQPGAGGAARWPWAANIAKTPIGIGAGEAASYIDGGYKSTSGAEAGVLRTSGSQG
jgi:hypothetical protein